MLARAPQRSSCRPASRPALCPAPRAARQLGRRKASRRPAAQQQHDCDESGGSGGAGGSGAARGSSSSGTTSPADHQRIELAGVRERLAAAQAQLQHCIDEEAFGAAAQQRDAVHALELRERALSLALAAEERSGVLHTIGQVIMHKRFGYR